MKIEKEFTLLKIENKQRINKEDGTISPYLIISVLDENLIPCHFFVFKDEIIKKIIGDCKNSKSLEKVLIDFGLSFNGKLWNCNLQDILFQY